MLMSGLSLMTFMMALITCTLYTDIKFFFFHKEKNNINGQTKKKYLVSSSSQTLEGLIP